MVIGVPAALSWYLGGCWLIWVPMLLFGFLMVAGLSTPLMLTIYLVTSCVILCTLIGSRDLGQEIYKALPSSDTGRGLLAGLGIAFIGIVADRPISAWANKRKAALGLG